MRYSGITMTYDERIKIECKCVTMYVELTEHCCSDSTFPTSWVMMCFVGELGAVGCKMQHRMLKVRNIIRECVVCGS